MEAYEKIKKIGRGTYGDVILVKHKQTAKMLALKKVVLENLQSSSSLSSSSRNSTVEQVNNQLSTQDKVKQVLEP